MLYLVFESGQVPYAIQASRIVEVIPRVELRPVARLPGYVAGLHNHGGTLVPVIDLGLILGNSPTPARLGTRILLADYEPAATSRAMLGLLVEDVDRLHHFSEPLNTPDAPRAKTGSALGRLLQLGETLAQEIVVDRLLPSDIRDDLYGAMLGIST